MLKQSSPLYYDQPTVSSSAKPQGNTETDGSYSNITLPVLLTWHDPNNVHGGSKAELSSEGSDNCWPTRYQEYGGDNTDCAKNDSGPESWRQIPPYGTQAWIVDFLVNYTSDNSDPAKRAIRFDPKEPPDPNNLTPPNSEGKLVDGIGPNGATARLLEFVTDKTVFNSRDNGWPCFFNSDSTIYWRARPCCEQKSKVYLPGQAKNDDTTCVPETSPNIQWWKFHTSSAPEPLGVTDQYHTKPQPDPDWNGTAAGAAGYVDNVDFCTAGLHWCSAKVDPSSSKAVFQQNIGHNQALAYEMAVSYNEESQLYKDMPDWAKQALNGGIDQINQVFDQFVHVPSLSSLINVEKKDCHYLLSDKPDPSKPAICKAEIVEPHGTITKIPATDFSNSSDQNFNRGFFTKNLQYDWSLKRCFDNSNAGPDACQQNTVNTSASLKSQGYGQTWSLKTVTNYDLPKPLLSSPENDAKANDQNASTPVGMPPTIAWKPQCGANSFEYELDEGSTQLVKKETTASQVTFVKDLPASASNKQVENAKATIKLDTVYKWKVQACWPSLAVGGDNSNLCDGKSWTDWFYFRTTGRPPQDLKAVGDNASNIPTTFSWGFVPGALSYVLELTDGPLTLPLDKIVKPKEANKPVSVQLLYPDLKPSPAKTYKWQVKTCADEAATANLCGVWSPKYSFTTSNLPAPQGEVSPKNLASLDSYPNHLAWNSVNGALAYRVTMDYLNKDANSECPPSGQLFDSVTTNNSFDPPGLALACLGSYTWKVASCFSAACISEETGAPNTFTFSINKGGGKASGFLVCGLRDDDPKTDWDERKPCQATDLFKILEKLIDFVLFKVSFWLLPILGALTGGLFYTHVGGADTFKKVQKMWRYIGIGYALIFFAWLLTTWALQALGYSGLWYKIL